MSATLERSTAPPATPAPERSLRSMVPTTLPPGVARFGAVCVATAAAMATGQALGAITLSLWHFLALLAGVLLPLVAVMLGLRLRAILLAAAASLLLAVPSTIVGQLIAASFDTSIVGLLLLPPAAVIAFIGFMLSGVPGARSLMSGLRVGALAALVTTLWPLLVLIAVAPLWQRPLEDTDVAFAVLATALPAPLAWGAVAMGRQSALQSGVISVGVRDGSFRVFLFAATIAAALWSGDMAQTTVAQIARNSALEGLAPTAGWIVGMPLFVALALTAWRLPKWLAVEQLRGRFEPAAVGESLVFIGLACLAAFVLWRLDPAGAGPGRAGCVAIAAGFAYAAFRLRFATPVQVPNAPLWIVVADAGNNTAVRRAAANAAGAWQAGQVVLLAVPADAKHLAGEHLRAAAFAGEIDLLFPTLPVHLEDWANERADAWTAMPVREIYAPAELWSQVFARLLEREAQVLFLRGPAAATSYLERLRGVFAPASLEGALIPRAHSQSVRPGMAAADVALLASDRSSGDESALQKWLRSHAPAVEARVSRFVMLMGNPADLELAERIAKLLHGARDAGGCTVECLVTSQWNASNLGRWQHSPLAFYRQTAVVLGKLISNSEPSGSGSLLGFLVRIGAWVMSLPLAREAPSEIDVVVLERKDEIQPDLPLKLLEQGAGTRVINRVIAVRTAAVEAAGRLLFPERVYSGQIHLAAGLSTPLAAEEVARKVLAREFAPIGMQPAAAPAQGVQQGAEPAKPQASEVSPLRAASVERSAQAPQDASAEHDTSAPQAESVEPLSQREPSSEVRERVKLWFIDFQQQPGFDVSRAAAALYASLDRVNRARYLEDLRAMELAARRLADDGPPDGATPSPSEFLLPGEFAPLLAPQKARNVYADLLYAGLAEFEDQGALSNLRGRERFLVLVDEGPDMARFEQRFVAALRARFPQRDVLGTSEADPFIELFAGQSTWTLVVIAPNADTRPGISGLELALEHSQRVIPVLLDGASIPMDRELYPQYWPLARRQALMLDGRAGPEGWGVFFDRLEEALRGDVPPPAQSDVSDVRILLWNHVNDSSEETNRLWRALAARFGPDSTHLDMRALLRTDAPLPRNPQELLRDALPRADAIVVVIGPDFVRQLRENPSQLGEDVPLRRKLGAALRPEGALLLVSVRGGRLQMPEILDDYSDLRALPAQPWLMLDDSGWDDGVQELGDRIEAMARRRRERGDPSETLGETA